jgi:hypothetical protein
VRFNVKRNYCFAICKFSLMKAQPCRNIHEELVCQELRVNNAAVSALNRWKPRKTGAVFVMQASQYWHRILRCTVLSHRQSCRCGSLSNKQTHCGSYPNCANDFSAVPNGRSDRCDSILTAPSSQTCPLVGPVSGGELECCCDAILTSLRWPLCHCNVICKPKHVSAAYGYRIVS